MEYDGTIADDADEMDEGMEWLLSLTPEELKALIASAETSGNPDEEA